MKTRNGTPPDDAPRARSGAPWGAPDGLLRRAGELLGTPWAAVGAVLVVSLLLGWQFVVDSSRVVPALDTAWYQWRAEFLQANEPGDLIAIQGAQGALAGGYRVAEPVLAALMRIVGGVGRETPTVVLSVLFRILAAVGMAAFAWKHRRSWMLFYLTLLVIPALFLLQRFFGFLDNFFALALMAGALLLLDRLRSSWPARLAVVAFLLLAGLSHPTTLIVFLLSMGAVAGYRWLRQRSFRAALRSEVAPMLWAGAAAVVLITVVWLGGLWGPGASFNEAAVPPPQPLQYFVDRSVNVLKGMQPYVLIPVMLLGLGTLAVSFLRRSDRFSEITLAWTLPLIGMFGFLLGAAYPYFRFFNATLAPLVATAVGFAAIIGLARRFRGRMLSQVAPAVAVVLVGIVLFGWWSSGLSRWNRSGGTWLTPAVRETLGAADAYMAAEPPGRKALFVVDAQPGEIVPYGKYKEFANAIYAGTEGGRIDDTFLFFGRIEDLEEERPSSLGNAQYDGLAADTAAEALAVLDRDRDDVVVFMPTVFNEHSSNGAFLEGCLDCERLSESGLHLVPGLMSVAVSEDSVRAARDAAAGARAFEAEPPGPFADLGGTLGALVRLGLLFVLPGWLLWRGLPERSWVEGLALVPALSIASVTTVGVLLVAALRGPLSPAVGWASWGVAVALGLVGWGAGVLSRVSARD